MEKRLSILENVLFVAGALAYWLLPPPWRYGGTALFAAGITIAAVLFARNLRELKKSKRELEVTRREVERLAAENRKKES